MNKTLILMACMIVMAPAARAQSSTCTVIGSQTFCTVIPAPLPPAPVYSAPPIYTPSPTYHYQPTPLEPLPAPVAVPYTVPIYPSATPKSVICTTIGSTVFCN